MRSKNHDYSGSSGNTPFSNFEMATKMGLPISREKGLMLRVMDKIARLVTFLESRELKVKESTEDACIDIINYMVLLNGMLKERDEQNNSLTKNDDVTEFQKRTLSDDLDEIV